jgi:hypothetical protein
VSSPGIPIANGLYVSVIDIGIIYLACGAPFGVYRAYSPVYAWYDVILATIAWPLVAIRLTASTALSKPTSIHDELWMLREEFEAHLLGNSSPEMVFEFREIFDRYTGLTIAAKLSATPAVSALFELTAHPSTALAEPCVRRSQKTRLERHLHAARAEFASFLAREQSEGIESSVEGLKRLIGDSALLIPTPEPDLRLESRRVAARVG